MHYERIISITILARKENISTIAFWLDILIAIRYTRARVLQ